MPQNQHLRWRTEDEISYVRGLGRWTVGLGDRLALLREYQRVAHQRDTWGRIQPEKVLRVVACLIADEERKLVQSAVCDQPGRTGQVIGGVKNDS